MSTTEIIKNVYWVGANDPSRKIFDAFLPIPDGTTYNSYLIKGSEKTALIDSVDPSKTKILLKHLEKLKIKKIDFIISQHAEQDHSGSLPVLLKKFPSAKIVTNSLAKKMLQDLLSLPEDTFQIIKNESELSLGDKTLKFFLVPWVHWPETMMTYLVNEEILFTCDLFGAHKAIDPSNNLFSKDDEATELSAKRYYAGIMMPFKNFVKKHTEFVRDLNPKIIATSHGPIYKNPEFILKLYENWTSEKTENQVVITWVSMHGSTGEMVDYLQKGLENAEIKVSSHNLTTVDAGALAMDLVNSKTLVLATPMVLTKPHPLATHIANIINLLKPKTEFLAIMGSFGWGGDLVKSLENNLSNLKAERLPDVLVKGKPKKDDFERLDALVATIVEKHKNS